MFGRNKAEIITENQDYEWITPEQTGGTVFEVAEERSPESTVVVDSLSTETNSDGEVTQEETDSGASSNDKAETTNVRDDGRTTPVGGGDQRAKGNPESIDGGTATNREQSVTDDGRKQVVIEYGDGSSRVYVQNERDPKAYDVYYYDEKGNLLVVKDIGWTEIPGTDDAYGATRIRNADPEKDGDMMKAPNAKDKNKEDGKDGGTSGDNKNVSVEAIQKFANEVMEQLPKYNQEVSDLVDQVSNLQSSLLSTLGLDGNNVEEGPCVCSEVTKKCAKAVQKIRVITEPNADHEGFKQELQDAVNKIKDLQAEYTAASDKLNECCKLCQDSAKTIEQLQKEIAEILGKIDENGKNPLEEDPDATKVSEPDETTDPNTFVGPAGSPGGGSPETYGSSPSYTPDTPTKEEEKEDDDDEDYGDGNEGNETEPTVQEPITTLAPLPTSITATPTATTPSATPKVTTPASTQPTTVTTSAAPVETHSGGGYSGGGGYSYNAPAAVATEEESVQEEVASSIDNIVKGKTATKIPTSSAPIAKASTTTARSTGSSVIPAASGIAAAAVIGLGAKAFLDKKKQEEEAEEEEQFL